MNYFRVRTSLNPKLVGNIPQVDNIIYNCDIWNDPKFIDSILFKKVDFKPIIANAILHSKSKRTDLIATSSIGFQFKLLISDKLKNIIKNYSNDSFQIFDNIIFHRDLKLENYYIINPFKIAIELLDFSNCEIFLMKNTSNKVDKLNILTLDEYVSNKEIIDAKGYPFSIFIDKISFLKNKETDFFVINHIEGGLGFFVSEKLKKEIEDAGCTGIEFQPAEMSRSEWMLRDGPRDQIYGRSW